MQFTALKNDFLVICRCLETTIVVMLVIGFDMIKIIIFLRQYKMEWYINNHITYAETIMNCVNVKYFSFAQELGTYRCIPTDPWGVRVERRTDGLCKASKTRSFVLDAMDANRSRPND